MTKKFYLCLFICLIICLSVCSAQNDDKFVNALRTCSSAYNESDTVNVGGMTAISVKSMSGWHNSKCTYKETLKINGQNITTTCSFTKPQVNELISVADAYYLTLKYGGEKPDTSSLDAVKNNPFLNVMRKYLQDPSVCSMVGL